MILGRLIHPQTSKFKMYDNWLLYNTELAQCVLVDCHSLSNYWDSENILNIPSLDANGTTNFGRGGGGVYTNQYQLLF